MREFNQFPMTEEYAAFRIELINKVMSEGLTPVQVADLLEDAADKFKEITYQECRAFRSMGDKWSGAPMRMLL